MTSHWETLHSLHRGELLVRFTATVILSGNALRFEGKSEFPLTVRYSQKVDSLHSRYAEYFWDAEFRHTVGATVTNAGQPYPTYSVFRNPRTGKRAVVLVDFNCKHTTELELQLLNAASDRLVVVRPESPDPQPFAAHVRVPPNSAAVVIEK